MENENHNSPEANSQSEQQTAPISMPNTHQETSTLEGMENFFDTYFRVKAPFQIPAGVREGIVKYGPWVLLVLLILSAFVLIPLLFIVLGLTVVAVPMAAMAGRGGATTLGYIGLIISLVAFVLEIIALPGLFARKLNSGWKLAYYSTLVSLVSGILSGSIVTSIIIFAVSIYILFQIRSYYK